MKVAGIIAEYNPFHNGHEYHIAQTKKLLSADKLVVLMSGDFVQRGECAIMQKHSRAMAALKGGADLVLEIPVEFCTSSAEYFAGCSVAIMDKLSVIDHLSFGSESGKIDTLTGIASVLLKEGADYSCELKRGLKEGLSFPTARERALKIVMGGDYIPLKSNDILGVEYIKALLQRKSPIKPFVIPRLGSYLDRDNLRDPSGFASALAVREHLLKQGDISENIAGALTPVSFELLSKDMAAGTAPLFLRDFSDILTYKLIYEKTDPGLYADITTELSASISKASATLVGFEALCERLCTRNYTRARISRSLLHILLNILKSDLDRYILSDYTSYVSVLGFKRSAKDLLSAIKKGGRITLITKNADAKKIIDPVFISMFDTNINASSLYRAVAANRSGSPYINPYFTSPVIID